MCRALVFAISVSALALAGCAAGSNATSSALPFAGAETVGDAAAIAAHRPTDSQNTAAAIEAIGALGSRIDLLADASADGPQDGLAARASAGACRDGIEFFAPARNGRIDSTETREFYDGACTQLARDTLRSYSAQTPGSEVVAGTTELYARGRRQPIATRSETAAISGASFTRFGFPSAAHGYTRTSVATLWIGNKRQSSTAASFTLLAGRGGSNRYCRAASAYSLAGVPSLDAAFAWDGSSAGPIATMRQSDSSGDVAVTSVQTGGAYVGPIGSLRLTRARSAACAAANRVFHIAGGEPAATFSMPVRATYRNGALISLSVPGASLGAYRLTAGTVRHGLDDRDVAGVLVSGRMRVASLETDTFGNGLLTVTSTGAQYRLIDWTIVG